MILVIDKKIDIETLHSVVDFYNQINSSSDKDDATIYLKCSGGNYGEMLAVIDIINKNKDKTTLIAYHCIASAGFELFYSAQCERIILNACLGMYHLGSTDITFNTNNKPSYPSDKATYQLHKDYYLPFTMSFCDYLGFTEKEKRIIKKGDDVYFKTDRLRDFLHMSKINNEKSKL
jgi:hypothetical protein